MTTEPHGFVPRPYPDIVRDLLTTLTGGTVRETAVVPTDDVIELRLLAERPIRRVSHLQGEIEITRVVRAPNGDVVLGADGEPEQETVGVPFRFTDADFELFATGAEGDEHDAIRFRPNGHRPRTGSTVTVNYYPTQTLPVPITDLNVGSVTRTMLESVARELAVQELLMENIYRSAFIETADGANLDKVVALVGVQRRPAGVATVQVRFTRAPGSTGRITVPVGTVVADADGNRYATVTPLVLEPGEPSRQVVAAAVSRGTAAVAAGALDRPEVLIAGVSGVTNEAPAAEAAAPESDDELRRRARGALAVAARGTLDALKFGLLSIPGVKDVAITEFPNGVAGEIRIDVAYKPEDPDVEAEVAERIADLRPAGVRVIPQRAASADVTVTAALTLAGAGVSPADEAELRADGRVATGRAHPQPAAWWDVAPSASGARRPRGSAHRRRHLRVRHGRRPGRLGDGPGRHGATPTATNHVHHHHGGRRPTRHHNRRRRLPAGAPAARRHGGGGRGGHQHGSRLVARRPGRRRPDHRRRARCGDPRRHPLPDRPQRCVGHHRGRRSVPAAGRRHRCATGRGQRPGHPAVDQRRRTRGECVMARRTALAEHLPTLYREGTLVTGFNDTWGVQFDMLDEAGVAVQRAHWFDATYDLDEAVALAGILDIAPEEFHASLGEFRAWVHALRDSRLHGGAVTREALRILVDTYTRGFQASADVSVVPQIAAWATEPDGERAALVENPSRLRTARLPDTGGWEPLARMEVVNAGIDPAAWAVVLTGHAAGSEYAPFVANRTTGQAFVFRGEIGVGQRLTVAPSQADRTVLRAELEGVDVTDRLDSYADVVPGPHGPGERASINSAKPLTRGSNELWFLPLAHYDTPGLDRVLLALADDALRIGRFNETMYDQSLFAQQPAMSACVAWVEHEPASFEIRLPAYRLTNDPGATAAGIAARERLEAGLDAAVDRTAAVGVATDVIMDSLAERQPGHDRLRSILPLTFRHVGPTGADQLRRRGRAVRRHRLRRLGPDMSQRMWL